MTNEQKLYIENKFLREKIACLESIVQDLKKLNIKIEQTYKLDVVQDEMARLFDLENFVAMQNAMPKTIVNDVMSGRLKTRNKK